MRRVRLLLLLLLLPNVAHAETWIVFPVFAEHPPPRDPTLLRMSTELAQTISAQVSGSVRLAKREERELSCPTECPGEIASMLSVEHVVSMHLAPKFDQLAVILFEPRRPPLVRKITCAYENGAVSCDAKALGEVFEKQQEERPLDEKAVHAAFARLKKELLRCGDQRADVRASARFRVRPDGRVTDVRIDPPEVENQKPYDCMARIVESLRVPPFSGVRPAAFRLPLPKGN